jgi:glutamyl-tRNA synthetase
MVNYLARLGWSYDDTQELFSRDELIEKFSLDRVNSSPANHEMVKAVIEALGDRLKVDSDILKLGRYFFTESLTYDPDAVKRRLKKDGVPALLRELDELLATTVPFDVATLEAAVHAYAEKTDRKMGDVVNPLRVAVTGQGVGPGLYDCLAILGRDTCRQRIAQTLEFLEVSTQKG